MEELNIKVREGGDDEAAALVPSAPQPPPDADGYTLLHVAARRGMPATASALLAAGADKDARARSGATPLVTACSNGKGEVVKVLLSHGADPSMADGQDQTPLHWATQKGEEGLSLVLLEAGADPSTPDIFSRSPLHWACSKGLLEVVKAAQEKHKSKPDLLNLKSQGGDTILHWAAADGQSQVVEYLLSQDSVKAGEKNNQGEKASDKVKDLALKALIESKAEYQAAQAGQATSSFNVEDKGEGSGGSGVFARRAAPTGGPQPKKMTIKLRPKT